MIAGTQMFLVILRADNILATFMAVSLVHLSFGRHTLLANTSYTSSFVPIISILSHLLLLTQENNLMCTNNSPKEMVHLSHLLPFHIQPTQNTNTESSNKTDQLFLPSNHKNNQNELCHLHLSPCAPHDHHCPCYYFDHLLSSRYPPPSPLF